MSADEISVETDCYLMALEPSSTRTGAAAFGIDGTLLSCELWHKAGDYADRVDEMCEWVASLIEAWNPEYVVLETPSLHQHARENRPMVGLAIYGYAVGAVNQLLRSVESITIDRVDPETWTRCVPKRRREADAWVHPVYREWREEHADTTRDVADAVTLGGWWFGLRQRHRLLAETRRTSVRLYEHRCGTCLNRWNTPDEVSTCQKCGVDHRSILLMLPEVSE